MGVDSTAGMEQRKISLKFDVVMLFGPTTEIKRKKKYVIKYKLVKIIALRKSKINVKFRKINDDTN